jgi:hypothetical protein
VLVTADIKAEHCGCRGRGTSAQPGGGQHGHEATASDYRNFSSRVPGG